MVFRRTTSTIFRKKMLQKFTSYCFKSFLKTTFKKVFGYTHSVAKGSSLTNGQNKLELELNSYLIVLRPFLRPHLRIFLSIHTQSQIVYGSSQTKGQNKLELELN